MHNSKYTVLMNGKINDVPREPEIAFCRATWHGVQLLIFGPLQVLLCTHGAGKAITAKERPGVSQRYLPVTSCLAPCLLVSLTILP